MPRYFSVFTEKKQTRRNFIFLISPNYYRSSRNKSKKTILVANNGKKTPNDSVKIRSALRTDFGEIIIDAFVLTRVVGDGVKLILIVLITGLGPRPIRQIIFDVINNNTYQIGIVSKILRRRERTKHRWFASRKRPVLIFVRRLISLAPENSSSVRVRSFQNQSYSANKLLPSGYGLVVSFWTKRNELKKAKANVSLTFKVQKFPAEQIFYFVFQKRYLKNFFENFWSFNRFLLFVVSLYSTLFQIASKSFIST